MGRLRDPHAALGAAVQALMGSPAFARQPFGAWSRVLVGQINRGHYALARRDGRTVGFLGYGRCGEEAARRWLADAVEPTSAECRAGPVVLLNAWSAEDAVVSRTLRAWLHRANADAEAVAAKRLYADGRVRPLWLPLRAGHAAHGPPVRAR